MTRHLNSRINNRPSKLLHPRAPACAEVMGGGFPASLRTTTTRARRSGRDVHVHGRSISVHSEACERFRDGGVPGQYIERLVVGVLVLERGGEGAGYVFAGNLTPPVQLLGGPYVAGALVLGQAAGTDDGVVEAALRQVLVGP